MVGTGQPVSEVCKRFEAVPQLLQNVRYADGAPLEHATVKSAIDAGKARLGRSGRLLVRPSGTEPVIRVMAEGDDEALVRQVVGDIAEAVRSAAAAGRRLIRRSAIGGRQPGEPLALICDCRSPTPDCRSRS